MPPTTRTRARLVEFTVRLLVGEEDEDLVVCVVGSASELGAWDVLQAVPMERVARGASESTWRVRVAFAAPATAFDYKYVVKHAQKHALVSWEGLPGNRTLTIAAGTNIARGALSSQSSTYTTSRVPVPGPRSAGLGNNGRTNQGFQEWQCCRTKKETNPWWEVDLGQSYAISSVHVWTAMTYHEQARHPNGRLPTTVTSSHASPLWMFVSKEPLGRGADSFDEAQLKATMDSSFVRAIEVQSSFDGRVRSLSFSDRKVDGGDGVSESSRLDASELPSVEGRYVRLQCAGVSCALQFAELEVYTQDVDDNEAAPEDDELCMKRDDGLYGFPVAPDADLREYVESGWLNPADDVAEVKISIGSFDSDKPAVQLLGDGPKHGRVAIEMRCEKLVTSCSRAVDCSQPGSGNASVIWEALPVKANSAALLDKESTELYRLLDKHRQRADVDISAYLNNDPCGAHASSAPAASPWLSRLAFVRLLEAEDVRTLSGKIVTQTYEKGESILHYAEQKRTIFYIRSGDVELLGPQSSTGSNVVGTLGEHSVFNEMGIFSAWSRQPALFKAKTDVVCELLEFDSLRTVLGTSKVTSIRNGYARSRHKAASPLQGRQVHYTDSTHAQTFCVKVPVAVVDGSRNDTNGLIYRWTFDAYECEKDAQSESCTKQKLLGSAFLLLSQINKQDELELTIPILSGSMDTVGQLTLAYLGLTPFAHPKNSIANVWRSYWRERPPITIGHRGMGRSHYQVDGYRLALTRENTLASFILAGRSGADFVEFDVQLTKDRVPIIYHDFSVNVGLEDKSAGSFGTKSEVHEIGIHDMSFRQLTHSHTVPVPHKGSKSQVLQSRVKKHWARLQGDRQVSSPRHGPLAFHDSTTTDDRHLVEFFPRLEDLLKHVPAEVGLNIEVKYPDSIFHAVTRRLSSFAINAYIDRVLQCVFDYAGSRRIFFSCFDPSVCIALRAKQTRYPVLFLTCGSMDPHVADARMTLQFAVNFAKMEDLQGIVSNSDAFLKTPELAPLVKKYLGTVLITWGDQNTNHEMVQLQKRYAIDGVISDNVIDLMTQDRKLQALANK